MSQLWDPRTVDLNDQNKSIRIENYKTVIRAALNLIKEVVTERKAKGKADPYAVPIILRGRTDKPDVRFVNFAYGPDPIDGVKITNGKGYPGALGQAESLFTGVWRLATDEEEEEEFKRQQMQKVDAAVLTVQTHAALTQATAASSEAYRQSVDVIRRANLQSVIGTTETKTDSNQTTVAQPAPVDAEKDEMRAQLAAMKEQIAQLTAPKAAKRGRPAKAAPVTEEPTVELATA